MSDRSEDDVEMEVFGVPADGAEKFAAPLLAVEAVCDPEFSAASAEIGRRNKQHAATR